jgi:acetylornithine deacetylase/succinyl-diaminopimelate desuccinylase-like protein
VAGENQTDDVFESYARNAGLDVQRFETRHGKPMLIVSLPGSDPTLGSVGFVHHSDVVGVEGQWTLGQPFSADLTKDEKGRDVLVGRGSLDTKGPACQILVAMKQLKQSGTVLPRTMKLYVFPDEETGGVDGAYCVSRNFPDTIKDVQYWVVEGSGVLGAETLGGLGGGKSAPYLAVAQKYTIPVQVQLAHAAPPDEAVHKTLDAMKRLDSYLDHVQWTCLGDKAESTEMFRRMGDFVGGLKGWAVRHLWNVPFVQRQMGPSLAAANHTDACKTDMYLSSNPNGKLGNENVKPSSASMVLGVDRADQDADGVLKVMRSAAGQDMTVDVVGDPHSPTLAVRLTLPQEHYTGGNHGSEADRQHDAVDVTEKAFDRIEKAFQAKGWGTRLHVMDVYTSKSLEPANAVPSNDPVTTAVTLDLRFAIDNDRHAVIHDIAQAVGPDFKVVPLAGQEEFDAHVRRLSYRSPLFAAAEQACHTTYPGQQVLFGNTTASNDTRYLLDVNPKSEALAFVPLLYTEHGAHAPNECVTVESLKSGVDWFMDFMKNVK